MSQARTWMDYPRHPSTIARSAELDEFDALPSIAEQLEQIRTTIRQLLTLAAEQSGDALDVTLAKVRDWNAAYVALRNEDITPQGHYLTWGPR